MTRYDIIRMAREAGFRSGSFTLSNDDQCVFVAPVSAVDCIPELERFAALVAAAEREACAKVSEQQIERWMDDRARYAASECAANIRARGQT